MLCVPIKYALSTLVNDGAGVIVYSTGSITSKSTTDDGGANEKIN